MKNDGKRVQNYGGRRADRHDRSVNAPGDLTLVPAVLCGKGPALLRQQLEAIAHLAPASTVFSACSPGEALCKMTAVGKEEKNL